MEQLKVGAVADTDGATTVALDIPGASVSGHASTTVMDFHACDFFVETKAHTGLVIPNTLIGNGVAMHVDTKAPTITDDFARETVGMGERPGALGVEFAVALLADAFARKWLCGIVAIVLFLVERAALSNTGTRVPVSLAGHRVSDGAAPYSILIPNAAFCLAALSVE